MRTFTTGAVSGMTDIPIKTLQRYIVEFRDLFSETAAQPRKGRRFTEKDVQSILTIRRGRAKGIPDQEIRQIVNDPASFPLEEEHQAADALELVANAYEIIQRTDLTLKEIERKEKQITLLYNDLRRMVYDINQRVISLELTRKALRSHREEIKDKPEQEEKKPGLLERLNNWVDKLPEE